MIPLLIQLSDKDKRVLLIIFIVIILAFAFVALIGSIIYRVMKWQGKRLDNLTHDVVVTHVVDDEKTFVSYARKKNWRLFFQQSWIPLVILLAGTLVLLIRNAACNDWSYNIFDNQKTGFTTLFFTWDFSDPTIYHNFFGMNLLCDWPKVVNTPHWSGEAWASYIFFLCTMVGGLWYLVSVQSMISRSIEMYYLSKKIYSGSLRDYNKYDNY